MDIGRTVGSWDVSGDNVCLSVFWKAARRGLGACIALGWYDGKGWMCDIWDVWFRERAWCWEELKKDKGMTRSIRHVTVTLPRATRASGRQLSCISVVIVASSGVHRQTKHAPGNTSMDSCILQHICAMDLCNPRQCNTPNCSNPGYAALRRTVFIYRSG